MKGILITGGAGFIGSHLAEELIKENEVVCVDNLSTGTLKNLEQLKKNERFSFIRHDVKEPLKVHGRIDRIYHLASRASPVDFSGHPVDILLTNSMGTRNVLELAKEKKARLLVASSSEVYGDPKEHPQREGYWGNVNPVGPRSCYDEGKRFSEALCMAYGREYGVAVRVARIFNTYGPRMRADDGRVMPNLINQALSGKKLTVYGKGSQTRSFCYVTDMVSGLVRLMESDAEGPVNLGNPEEMRIIGLAKKILKSTGSRSVIAFSELPENDPLRRKPDITRAKALGWEPRVGFDEGLSETIKWFRGSA